MNSQAEQVSPGQQPAMIGNPMLSQIREFIEAGNEPPASLDPLGILRRALRGREGRVALAMLLVALLGAVGAYFAINPAYQSSGMVRVLAREAKILYADSDDSRLRLYDAFVTAEMELLQSRPVLEAALADQPMSAGAAGVTTVTCRVEPISDGLRMTAEIAMPALAALLCLGRFPSLSVVLLVYIESDVFAHESGLLAVVVMGLVIGTSAGSRTRIGHSATGGDQGHRREHAQPETSRIAQMHACRRPIEAEETHERPEQRQADE